MTNISFLYTTFGVILPCGIAIVLLVLATVLSRSFTRKKYPLAICMLPYIFWVAILLCCMVGFSSNLVHPLSAALQPNRTKYITTGYVEDVVVTPAPPVYYDRISKSWSTGNLLKISGETYYIPVGNIKPGDAVDLVWGNDEKVVFQYALRDKVSEGEVGTRVFQREQPQQLNEKRVNTGRLMSGIGFWVFVAFVFLQYPLGKRLSAYFRKKDSMVLGHTVFNPIGSGIQISLVLPLVIAAIGAALSGSVEALIVFLIVLFTLSVMAIANITTQICIVDDFIQIKKFRSTESYQISDISKVQFVSSLFPYNRRLLIVFHNGKQLHLDQMEHFGLESIYNELSKQ